MDILRCQEPTNSLRGALAFLTRCKLLHQIPRSLERDERIKDITSLAGQYHEKNKIICILHVERHSMHLLYASNKMKNCFIGTRRDPKIMQFAKGGRHR